MRRCCIPVLLLSLTLLCGSKSQAVEPVSRDKVIQQLELVHYGTLSQQEPAQHSLLAMGTNAIPTLIELLGYQETQIETVYRKSYYEAPPAIRQTMAKPADLEGLHKPAAYVLRDMPECRFYVRKLLPLMRDSREEVRELAANVIATHADAVRRTDQAFLLELVPFLKDEAPAVRRHMINALQMDVATLPRVKTAMENALMDHDEEVRNAAALAMLLGDKNHAGALATVKSFFSSTNVWIKLNAGVVYIIKQPDSPMIKSEVVPLFSNNLSSTNEPLVVTTLMYLRGYPRHFRTTVPEVQKLLTNSSLRIRMEATNALREIAPELLKPAKP